MNRILFSLLFLVMFSATAFADLEVYKVQKDDTLWALSGKYLDDPTRWGELLDLNPYLKEPGRMYDRGDKGVVVIVRPGEQLRGLTALGISGELMSLSELKAEAGISESFYDSRWFGLLASILLFLVLVATSVPYAIFRAHRWRFLNPITSGSPVVEGGIPPTRPCDVEERFQRIAERHYGEENPSANLSAERPVRVGEIESGFLSGNGMVQYRDRREPRRLRREPAYRSHFRFPDEHKEELYFLQGCANDVIFSWARYVGFAWTSDRAVVPAPHPTREASPTPLRVATRSGEMVDAIPMPMATVTASGLRIVVPESAFVRVGEKGKISISVSHACDITIGRVLKKVKVRASKPAAPAAIAS
ncbi:MAG: Peptidoglycan-binding protein [Candidatus Giovannonibacteria bacterium GW2011_GWC2_44_9]|uniref:Peptidoglycan-binding protein n=2 Tax=Candidatus Giovannoniibacteriota TaxID=1752738 RepID=A0A0G1IWQ1_9BACT|nr:MAG: Peptidoglycan-binding protein [Candidatus Giovannonibacteria bacterium GW2011_GWA1_44_29]KKT84019.1 MAG: Peptidoglycan-binding protein [Candidatus Giovannonibacteria bacterium GW2011_GWC2_44_9]KKT91283.1 MAG: Peptidoglycan-binding protein [Parcubacteria group bacterium GW2011_GWC1_45_13]KKU29806.1 MAG: Peptidoglycan-binding protein [Candidatus Giovannonibacteria bacterium GW2011_GWB1_46_20]